MGMKKLRKSAAGSPVISPLDIVAQLSAIGQTVPVFDVPSLTPAAQAQLASVDPRFVAAVANAIGTTPEVQQLLGSSDEELRNDSEESLRWTSAIEAARALVALLERSNRQRRQRVGLVALQAYSICRQLVRDNAGHADRLGTHVAEMKRLKKSGRGRKAAPQPAPNQAQSETQPK